jgi:UDP-N-acetylmuramoyl-L-alanyl-D-glutamate--2,6-diaminopimelate ligase
MRDLLQYEYSRTLNQIADFLEISHATENPLIRGLSLNSQKIESGDLFLALQGVNTHGIRFLNQVKSAGAGAILTDDTGYEIWQSDSSNNVQPLPILVTKNVRGVLGPLSSWFYGGPSHDLRLYGVTGTNGKTTVSYLLDHIWRQNKRESGLMGTVETRVGAESFPSVRTTVEAPDLQALLATFSERHISNVVMEVSSHSLALHRVDGTRFATVAFTNLSQDHLDFHFHMESYYRAKRRLFTLSFAENAIICTDTEWGSRLYSEASIPALDISLVSKKAAWHLVDLPTTSPNGTQFSMRGPNGILLDVNTQLKGEYNVANAMMAIALAVDSGIDPLSAGAALANALGAPGRLEKVAHPGGVQVFIDYAHTPDAVARVIAAVRTNHSGQIIGVLGCGGDRDSSKRPLMGAALAQGCDIAIFTSDNPRTEDARSIIEQMEPKRFTNVRTEMERHNAIELALELAAPGDLVLILGKGHESGQEINGVVYPFIDSKVAKEIIGRLK